MNSSASTNPSELSMRIADKALSRVFETCCVSPGCSTKGLCSDVARILEQESKLLDADEIMAAHEVIAKASLTLGITPIALAKTIDLAALIQAAEAARETLQELAKWAGDVEEWNEGGHAFEAAQKVKAAINPIRDLLAASISGGGGS